MFPAKYASQCSNGHEIKVGDIIGYKDTGHILCVRVCINEMGKSFASGTKPTLYSNKFCGNCFMELPLAGGECQNCG